MIRVNLISERKLAKKKTAFLPIEQQVTAGCCAILVAGALVCGWRYWSLGREAARLTSDIEKAQKETNNLKAIIAQVEDFEQQKADLQQRVELIEELRKEQTGPVHMLDEISRSLPPLLWLTNLKQSPNNEVLIDGRSNTLTSISDFVASLESTGYFQKSIEIVSTTSDTSVAAEKAAAATTGEMIKFQIKAVFKTPGGDAKPIAAAASTQRGN